ncbi:Uncharacterised protein [Mycobacterium tuberculosis]|nr:Uncharacterised protein [Mycobacterium tuberculosis]CKV30701.1 Uncharacterised protein [Mycobacterium tuberculosis]CNV85789.1 Uncharacterised protein [Mycobacterium tuberculosis]CNW07200.1 Uncharacterised protein [Mycobacterium tuberculosis]CNW21701.1 Uncharacterised protein [Mycobacterium tuberculosis]
MYCHGLGRGRIALSLIRYRVARGDENADAVRPRTSALDAEVVMP